MEIQNKTKGHIRKNKKENTKTHTCTSAYVCYIYMRHEEAIKKII